MTDRRPLIDAFCTLLSDTYVFADVAERVVAVLRGNDYDRFDDDAAFAAAVTADAQSAANGDKHLRLEYGEPRPAGPAKPKRHRFDKVEITEDNIGYVRMNYFWAAKEFGDIAAAAMTLVADTDALIIDLRGNKGAEMGMVALVCAYLLDDFTHLNDLYLRRHDLTVQFWTPDYAPGRHFGGTKPIWVLTGPVTFSAGEELAYNLQALGRATIVGERTRGGAHPTTFHQLTDCLYASVPWARSINPVTGANWEGVGVTPDVEVPAEDALTRALELARAQRSSTTSESGVAQQTSTWPDSGSSNGSGA